MVRATLEIASGEGDLYFFNQPWMQRQLEVGRELEAAGDVVELPGARVLSSPRLATAKEPGTKRLPPAENRAAMSAPRPCANWASRS